jgi:hypothetical protein
VNRSHEAVQRDYEEMLKNEEHYARRAQFAAAKGDTSENEATYWPEARRARADRFKAAAAEDGYTVVEPPSPEAQKAADLAMVNLNPRPADYSVDLSSIPDAHPDTGNQLRGLVASLEYLPGAGSGLIDRIVQVSAARKNLPAAERAQLAEQDRAELLRRAGGQEALNQQMEAVRVMLLGVQGPHAQFARALADDVMVRNDRFVFNNLLRQATGRQMFYKSRAKH